LKKYIFLTVIYCFLISENPALAQQPLFDEANSHLSEGRYQQAVELYQSIAEDGYESGALWQNLGVAYTRLDSLGKAKYYFLRAEKYNETRQQAESALQYVNNQFPRQSAVLPALPWVRFINFLSNNIGLKVIALTAMFLLYAGIAFKIGAWFRVDLKKTFNYIGYSSMGLSAILFACSIIIQYQQNRYSTGVMIDNEAPVYQQPEENSSVISTAYEGYRMQVNEVESDQQPSWKYVRLENGMYGWIQNDHIMTF
jgi:tetratricopeptide (TPR) repeat protein